MTQLSNFETKKLAAFEKMFGTMSSEEALKVALESEQIARDCGPFDFAYPKFIDDTKQFETYAVLLEKAGK